MFKNANLLNPKLEANYSNDDILHQFSKTNYRIIIFELTLEKPF